MMNWISGYLLRITIAALVCGIAIHLLGEKDTLGRIIRLLAGILMALTVVSPWTSVKFDDLTDYFENLSAVADGSVSDGENMARGELETIIKSQTQAYILDKADSFGADLTVEVILSSSEIPIPCSVRIAGEISPYGKSRLSQMIAEDLAIALEDQIWTG